MRLSSCQIKGGREYDGFRNPRGLRVRVVGGAGTGWQITTPRNPQPLARVDGFVEGLSGVEIYLHNI